MVVEVHCIPTINIEWDHALPWITSPPNVIFIQPHGFLEESYVPLAVEDIDWVEVNYGDGDDYEGNITSVYLGNHDYEKTKRSYVTKIVNKPQHNRLLPDDAYLHWDDAEFMVNAKADTIMEDSTANITENTEHIANNVQSLTDDVEGIVDNTQSLADDVASPALTLVEPDHSLLQISTTMSPPPSDDEDVDMFGEIKVGLIFCHSIGHTQMTNN